jgi:hypothetical protein
MNMSHIHQVLATFQDGQMLVFDTGRFDVFRVSFYDASGKYLDSPTDIQLFSFLLTLGNNQAAWDIITLIAGQIHQRTKLGDLDIPALSGTLEEQKMFSALAAAMIAEERKANSKLHKRVKLLGCYQVLMQGMEPRLAANWSRGQRWREIDQECVRCGF